MMILSVVAGTEEVLVADLRGILLKRSRMDEIEKSMAYERQMAIESLFVGAGNVASFMLVQKLFPKWKPVSQVFLAGVLFHLTAEASGLNEYYLEHGAATLYHEGQNKEYYIVPEQKLKCQMSSTPYLLEPSLGVPSPGLSYYVRYSQ
jgi:hypothetical protein